jgi:hypothetical protein
VKKQPLGVVTTARGEAADKRSWTHEAEEHLDAIVALVDGTQTAPFAARTLKHRRVRLVVDLLIPALRQALFALHDAETPNPKETPK